MQLNINKQAAANYYKTGRFLAKDIGSTILSHMLRFQDFPAPSNKKGLIN
jgi:hypothetical protein